MRSRLTLCLLSLVFVLSFVLSSHTASATEPELPDNYVSGITRAEEIEEGYTYEFVEFDNLFLENVVIGTPDEFQLVEAGEPNVYAFSGKGSFGALSGSTAGYNSTTNNYNFVANATILIPLDALKQDYEWLINEEYTFTLQDGYVNVSSVLGGLTASYNPSNYNTALINQRKFVNAGVNFRPLSEEIFTLDYITTINGTTQHGSVYNYQLDATQTGNSTSFKISDIKGEAIVTYTGDVSGKNYYLAVNFTKGFSATGSSQTTIAPNSEGYVSNSAVVTATSFDFPYSGEITVTYELPVDETVGLLSGIIEWIQGIYNSIVELPSRIWTYISEGLRDLFIPSEEDIAGIKDDWDELLATRFGAMYEAGDLIVQWANSITEKEELSTIDMPEVSIDLVGETFTFGGMSVQLVPENFKGIVGILKTLIDIVCTIAFLNSMRKKYDELVR